MPTSNGNSRGQGYRTSFSLQSKNSRNWVRRHQNENFVLGGEEGEEESPVTNNKFGGNFPSFLVFIPDGALPEGYFVKVTEHTKKGKFTQFMKEFCTDIKYCIYLIGFVFDF